MPDEFARPDGARTEVVRQISEASNQAKQCPFCVLDARNEVILETSYWRVFHNLSPAAGSEYHIMLATREHVKDFTEVSKWVLLDFFECVRAMKVHFGLSSYSLVARLGQPDFNAATVYHLHAHIVASDRKPVDPESVDLVTKQFYELIKAQSPGGEDPLEFVDRVREGLDALRAAEQGRAYPIRFKLSHRVDDSGLPRR